MFAHRQRSGHATHRRLWRVSVVAREIETKALEQGRGPRLSRHCGVSVVLRGEVEAPRLRRHCGVSVVPRGEGEAPRLSRHYGVFVVLRGEGEAPRLRRHCGVSVVPGGEGEAPHLRRHCGVSVLSMRERQRSHCGLSSVPFIAGSGHAADRRLWRVSVVPREGETNALEQSPLTEGHA